MDTEETAEEAESALNAALHSEHWGRHMSHDGRLKRCIVVCRMDDPRPPKRCPSCFGHALSVPQWQAQLEPPPGRAYRSARWLAGWFAAFLEALSYLRVRPPVCPACEGTAAGGEA